MAENEEKQRRIRRSAAEKLRILAEARMPGASVARVARENGVNANQVYAWRGQEARGRLAAAGSQALLAVRLTDGAPRRGPGGGGLELECGRGRLRIEAGADPALLRIVLERLIR